MCISEMQRKVEQIFVDLDTIAFEFHVWLQRH